ncbi:hypothetical protein ACV333_32815, partial [Pseudomonas aeruginosa]
MDIQLSWNTLAARAVPKAGRVAKSAAEGNVCRLSAASDEVALVSCREIKAVMVLSAASDEVALVLCKACRRQYHYRFNFAAGA